MRKRKVWLVQSSVTPEPWMPLACGYLKAAAMADPTIASEVDIRIFSFGSETSTMQMCDALYHDELPDVIGFSVLGWNYPRFQRVSEVFRMLNPEGWILYGGNHVANQAKQIFEECPHVDVVVNGEGELAFVELLRSHLAGQTVHQLHHVEGISFKASASGQSIATTASARLSDLDRIPSPLLSGAVPLFDRDGAPLYPNGVLMETNRGCPFRCSFCFWGGAIGQKVREFSRERLRAELDFIGRSGISSITLCDANFGMIPTDETFVEDLLATKDQYGFPRALITAWGKNKSDLFYRVVEALTRGRLFSSFIISLQSTNPEALRTMRRSNMKINDWKSLADWCSAQGLHVSSELIWGCPGETEETFLAGFDEIAAKVDRVACYDLKLMPNTEYWDKRSELGIVAKRGEKEDFYTVLFHNTMTLESNRRMFRFLFWQKLLHDFCTFRSLWRPLANLGGVSVSQALLSLDTWFDEHARSKPIDELLSIRDRMVSELDVTFVSEGVRTLFRNWGSLRSSFEAWFESEMVPQIPAPAVDLLREVFRFDLISMPIYDRESDTGDLEPLTLAQIPMLLRRDVSFAYDVPKLVLELNDDRPASLRPQPTIKSFLYQRGFAKALERNFPAQLGSAYAGEPLDPEQLRALGLVLKISA